MNKNNKFFCNANYAELLLQVNSYDSHMRENALVELEKYPSIETVRVLLERVNDWISKVGKVAKRTIFNIYQQDTALFFG